MLSLVMPSKQSLTQGPECLRETGIKENREGQGNEPRDNGALDVPVESRVLEWGGGGMR